MFRMLKIIGLIVCPLLLLFFIHKSDNNKRDRIRENTKDTAIVSNVDFPVYNGMNFKSEQTATLAQTGMEPIAVHYAGPIFGISAKRLSGSMHLPDKSRVLELARQTALSGTGIGVIDIEHWPVQPQEGTPDQIQHSLHNLLTVLEWFREGAPNVEWGYYGEVPIRNYWDAIKSPSSDGYQAWAAANNRLKPLANEVDILFPSIYTFYNRPQEWVTYAKAQIAEARRLNPDAKVYAYLWPVYHRSNKNGLAGQLIDADFWRLQLETVREHADGVVIYVSSNFDFDTSHPWWQVTQEFIQEL